jgi:hypothetical protein
MNQTIANAAQESGDVRPAWHRYQIYRQSRNGVHQPYGPMIDSQADAVAQFVHTTPAFDGGGVRLWDHREQRVAASAEWTVDLTGFGFPVRTRSDVFYEDNLRILAHVLKERETLEERTGYRARRGGGRPVGIAANASSVPRSR